MGGRGSGTWRRRDTKATTAEYLAVRMTDLRSRLGRGFRLSGFVTIDGYVVAIDQTPCHFGGMRTWFLCPWCQARRTVVYLDEKRIRCRTCLGLQYPTQSRRELSRAIARASKLRVRLGGGPSLLDPFPTRPRRMHARTYARLRAEAEAVEREVGERIRARFAEAA